MGEKRDEATKEEAPSTESAASAPTPSPTSRAKVASASAPAETQAPAAPDAAALLERLKCAVGETCAAAMAKVIFERAGIT